MSRHESLNRRLASNSDVESKRHVSAKRAGRAVMLGLALTAALAMANTRASSSDPKLQHTKVAAESAAQKKQAELNAKAATQLTQDRAKYPHCLGAFVSQKGMPELCYYWVGAYQKGRFSAEGVSADFYQANCQAPNIINN